MSEPQPSPAPKVFISHASEDKERFVRGFAGRLRANGVDAWLDEWELLPGDSLVKRIFSQGIGEADVFIVVLTANSIDKPWVQKELDVGVVRQIEDNTRLIPIVAEIDADRIPESLRGTLWQRIDDLTSYDVEFERILRAIYGASDKPALGPAPTFVTEDAASIDGLTRDDSLVLKALGLATIVHHTLLNTEAIVEEAAKLGVPADTVYEALDVFEQHGLVELTHVMGQREPVIVRLWPSGSDLYFRAYRPDYNELMGGFVSAVVNEDMWDCAEIASRLDEPETVIEQIADILEAAGHLTVTKSMGGSVQVHNPKPTLKRMLR